ncbi:PREDICTED: G-type lectin S-receptor-like serine/threonine-protein kinase LECRK3 [Ipomoea nil]|uniref:G-type lectin S-receptor-like serine/threonine-protein kinase LECRK3 n=1 Tax=Ipomoea nil TaxID=35883 RepID=UPI000901EE90|nr:PREDICTED: G-type lectin S-receptor-like serine/threonine-protein kinase LECRK3 [Ipomoea nil]
MGYPLNLLHLLFSGLLLLPFHTCAKNNNNNATIGVGSTLTATTTATTKPWVSSPSGDFAFGFRQLQATADEFLLCIWYANLHERTIVWLANTSTAAPAGSTVGLEADSGLILRDPQGNKLWMPDGLSEFSQVDHGFLNDTGNLVLVGRDSRVVWDTFAHPTDTLLPTQEMAIGTMLASRRSEANFSQGRFYLQMQDDGNLVLLTKTLPQNSFTDRKYYSSQTSDPANKTNSGLKLIFSSDGSLLILKRSNATKELSPPRSSSPDLYLRLTLDFDGVLSLYRIPKNNNNSAGGNQTWTSIWSQPDNICYAMYFGNDNLGGGACGYNSVCSVDANKRPSCECPPHYSLLDPSDKYGSCKPDFVPPTCDEPPAAGKEKVSYDLIEVPDTDWLANDMEGINPTTKEECKMACLNDCLCEAAVFAKNGCWKKRLPMSNGVRDTSRDLTGFIKVRKADFVPPLKEFPAEKKDQRALILAGSVLLGTSVFINFLLITAACLGFFFIYKPKIKKLTPTNTSSVQSNLCHFSYKELVEATNGFKEELGRGASAIVYKGEIIMLVDSRNIVAVKKLDRVAHDSGTEFMSEVTAIGQTHHKHLVRLLGYCNEEQHQILVYEYMSNGTLASFLFGDLTPSWSQRIKIALGIARGLTYLHEECSTQIIHCDIKPQNILLDDYYNARISDFGLAKLLRMNESRTQTNIRGTKGYVAPEWFRNNKVTAKVDVYSFGVLLMEIITCRRNVEDVERWGGDKAILTDWVTDCFLEKRLGLLVENDEEALNDRENLEKFVMISIWCIQEDSSLRPTMRKVSQMLEGVVQVPVPPNPNPFTVSCPKSLALAPTS